MNNKQSLINSSQLQQISQQILEEAGKLGANQAEVAIAASKGFSVSVHGGDVERVEYAQDKIIEVTVYCGKRTGSASISDVRSEAIKSAVAAACHIAKFTDEDPASGLADKSELAFHYPQLKLSEPWNISVDEAIQLACECEREALQYDKRLMSAEDVSVGTMATTEIYANSNGFIGAFDSTRHEIGCVLIAKQNNEMQRDYSYTIATRPSDLSSISTIAKEAAEKTVNRLGGKRLSTTHAPVIFIAEEARGLLGHFAAAIAGNAIYRKSSFLLDQLDKKIFPDFITLQEQPHLDYALGSAPFDDDGVATKDNIFIAEGILQRYALSIYAARKLKMNTTGNAGGTHNLTINTSNQNLSELLKSMDRGLLITEMMGHGINLVTGDYSRGVGGFWVERGEIQYPVHEITVAGNLKDIYSHIVAVANDMDIRGNVRTGSILIEQMMIAGN